MIQKDWAQAVVDQSPFTPTSSLPPVLQSSPVTSCVVSYYQLTEEEKLNPGFKMGKITTELDLMGSGRRKKIIEFQWDI